MPTTPTGTPPGATDTETLAAATAKASPAKKQKLAPSDKECKLHPTGVSLGYKGKDKQGITMLVQELSEASECPLHVVVFIDTKGNLHSMEGKPLDLTCAAALHKFLKKSVKKGNTVVRFRHDDDGMQNGVHADVLEAMVKRAQEKDQQLNHNSFEEDVHGLVDELAKKFKWVDNCKKTCCQAVDLHLLVHRCD